MDQEFPYSDVFKVGRSTGLTVGHYSHVKSDVNLSLPLNDSDERDAVPRRRLTQEHVIVTEDPRNGEQFSRSGDAGSWVCDCWGTLIGMLLGSSASSVSYFTPIRLIVEDIEERTGMKVELL